MVITKKNGIKLRVRISNMIEKFLVNYNGYIFFVVVLVAAALIFVGVSGDYSEEKGISSLYSDTALKYYASGIALITLYLNSYTLIYKQYAQRIENTYKLIEKWDDQQFLSARKLTRQLGKISRHFKGHGDDIVRHIIDGNIDDFIRRNYGNGNGDQKAAWVPKFLEFTKEFTDSNNRKSEDIAHSIITIMNYVDHARVSIQHNRIDLDMFRSALGEALISIISRFQDYIINDDDREVQRKYYKQMLKLMRKDDE